MMKTVWIYINGILCRPGAASAWNGRAVTWTHRRLGDGHVAEKFEYMAFAVTRGLFLDHWAAALAGLVRAYWGHTVNLVGHSNGCELIVRALPKLDGQQLGELHLFAPACEADCRRNGFNGALENGQVGSLHLYRSGRDRALGLARLSQLLCCQVLRYGTLGLEGPGNLSFIAAAAVYDHVEPDFGHSDWWSEACFEATMRKVTMGR